MSFEVTIYIETGRGPVQKIGVGMYTVEFIKSNGDTETRQGIVREENTSENALALKTVIKALMILKKQCDITVITENTLILSAERYAWLDRWRMEGWINSRGEQIKHKELWQQISDMMDRHLIIFTTGRNPYKTLMYEAIEKEKQDNEKHNTAD